jgi:hypothetical protein
VGDTEGVSHPKSFKRLQQYRGVSSLLKFLGQAIGISNGRRGAVNGPCSHVKDIDNGRPNPSPCLSRSTAWILVMRVDRIIKCDYNYGHEKGSSL